MTHRPISAVRGATAAMGTRFEIAVVTHEMRDVQPLIEEALREIEELHSRLTRFTQDSLLSFINRTAARTAVRLDQSTFDLFKAALAVRDASGGAFDITLGRGTVLLDDAARTIVFDRHGVELDLGGIAKGFALDRAAMILREGGIASALLHGGTSSVVAIGAPPDACAWCIALARGRAPMRIELRDAALSLSASYATPADTHAHIMDARDGSAMDTRRFAVVIGPSACLADAWSTAITVLGKRPAALSNEWTTYIELDYE